MDKELKFDEHLNKMYRKASNQVTALGRIARILPFRKHRHLSKTFIKSQFSYCPLVWIKLINCTKGL